MYRLATIAAVYVVQTQPIAKNRTVEISASGIVTLVIPEATLSVVRVCSYTVYVVRSTIGLLSDSYGTLLVPHSAI